MLKEYQHRRLTKPTSFRLLRLEPAKDLLDPLKGYITEYFLDGSPRKLPKYEALSYVWNPPGMPDYTDQIEVAGEELNITLNCSVALRYLRHRFKRRLLFVDAVCIDQKPGPGESMQERNHQISIMGQVYQQANCVLIWLGEWEKGKEALTSSAFLYLRALSLLLQLNPSNEILGPCLAWLVRAKNIFGNEFEGLIFDVFTGPWFGRIWTLQELALARRCRVVSGHASMRWEPFTRAGEAYLIKTPSGRLALHSLLRPFLNQMHSRSAVKRKEPTYSGAVAGAEFLLLARSHGCCNPSDKIYGLFHILKLLNVTLPEPNYEKPAATLYEEVTFRIIEESGSLWLLDFVNSKRVIAGLPSWIPDWYCRSRRKDQRLFPNICEGRLLNRKLLASRESGTLPIEGRVIGKISRHCTQLPLFELYWELNKKEENDDDVICGESLMTAAKHLREWYRLACEHPSHSNFQGISVVEDAFLGVLYMDQGQPASSIARWRMLSSKWLSILKSSETIELSQSDWERRIPPDDSSYDAKDTIEGKFMWLLLEERYSCKSFIQSAMWFHNKAIYELHDSTFFISDMGYMGTGFYKLAEGDSIVLFPGANMPMIVRADGEFWNLIGPAYVQGVMNGEAWPEEDSAGTLETFVLI